MTSELPERRGAEQHPPESGASGDRLSKPGASGTGASGTRASDAEREQVAERLREAMAEGRLDMEEFDERLGLAYSARTHGDLVPLVHDLPAPGPAPAAAPAAFGAQAAGTGAWAERVGGSATSRSAFSFMGGFGRKGKWTVARRFRSVVFMGGGEIDLREANFEEGVTVISCYAVMGGVQITAPPELDVEVRGFGFMGAFGDVPDRDDVAGIATDPNSPKVIVTGFVMMGGVGVERKLRKEERRRIRAERGRESLAAGGGERYEERIARHEEHRAAQAERRERHRKDRRARHDERRETRRLDRDGRDDPRDGHHKEL